APRLETCQSSRSMVVGSGYDPCVQDRRRTMADRATDWAGNAKDFRRSPRLLACVAVRQFWSFCAAELDVYGHIDVVRAGRGRRCCNVRGTGAGLWRPRPRLTGADAPSGQNFGGRTEQPKCTLAPRRAARLL